MEHRIRVGDIVEVTITGIQPYGAFALLPDYSTGLIHISEISDKYVRNVENFVRVGEKIKVKVIDIDEEHHQAKLSLKALHHYRRKQARSYHNQRLPIRETPKGFEPLRKMLPHWIEDKIKEENRQ